MNNMFKRIEQELDSRQRTKAWLAERLNESTQNINNWKKRSVPAAKVRDVARVLGVSREYLEGTTPHRQPLIHPTGDGHTHDRAQENWSEQPSGKNQIRFTVFVDRDKLESGRLLKAHLRSSDGLFYVFATSWRVDEPFIELSIWAGENEPPHRIFLLLHCIVGIAEYRPNLHPGGLATA